MKIAVSSSQPNMDGDVNPMFGRCRHFLIVEVGDGKIKGFESVENKAANQSGAAGISAAQTVAEKDVKAVITGNMGPRAFDVMNHFKIDVYSASGPIKDAVQMFINGKLEKIQGPGQMHFGLGRGQGGTGRGMGRGFQ